MKTAIFVNPAEFGLEETKAQQIQAQFAPMLSAMVELEKEFNELITLPVEEQATSLAARALRLKYVKVRSGTEKIHKAQKAFYLAGGRFVDGWKNAQAFASQEVEEKLEAIENYYSNMEKERIAKLQEEREALLSPFNLEGFSTLNLGEMSQQVWDIFFTGTQANAQAKKEAAAAAEAARVEAERIEAEERERMRVENERLAAQVAEEQRKAKAAEETAKAVIRAQAAKAEKEKAQAAEAAREAQEKAAKIIAEMEREKREKEEQEAKRLAIEKAAEEKRKQQEEEAREAELSRGDDEKFAALLMDLDALKTKYSFKSKKSTTIFLAVCELITKTIIFTNQKLKA